MNTGRDTKLHYKMYKKGRAWVFAGILVMSWGVSSQTAQADTTVSDNPASNVEKETSQASQLAERDVELSNKEDKEVTPSDSSSDRAAIPESNNNESEQDLDKDGDTSNLHQGNDNDQATESKETLDNENTDSQNKTYPEVENDSNVVTQPKPKIEKQSDVSVEDTNKVDKNRTFNRDAAVVRPELLSEKVVAMADVATQNGQLTDTTLDVPLMSDTATDFGQLGTCTWSINNGDLHIGAGEFNGDDPSGYSWPWQKSTVKIQKIYFDGDVVASGSLSGMFDDNEQLTSIVNIERLNTANVNSMEAMFCYDEALEELDLSKWNISNVKTFRKMMFECQQLKEFTFPEVSQNEVTDTHQMFYNCYNLAKVEFNDFTFSNVEDEYETFVDCAALTNFGDYIFEISSSAKEFFSGCRNLTDVNVNLLGDRVVTTMMFSNCSSLTKINFENETPALVGNAVGMFAGCTSLKNIDHILLQLYFA